MKTTAFAVATTLIFAGLTAWAGSERNVDFAEVEDIFARRCIMCHTDNGLMGPAPEGYLMTTYEQVISPRDRVRVVPGYPAASELVRRVKGQSRPAMPFNGPPYLDTAEIDMLTDWVTQGAAGPDNSPAPYPLGARVRLEGILAHQWQLADGLDFIVNANTRIDKSPQPGDYVQIRGRLGGNGLIKTDRIRRE